MPLVKAKRQITPKLVYEKTVARFAQKNGAISAKKAAKKKVVSTVAKEGRLYRIYPSGFELEEKGKSLPRKVTVKKIIKIS